jgi:hypothetical protein
VDPIANQPLLTSLGRRAARGVPPVAAVTEDADPCGNAGCHPDIVERVWGELAPAVPGSDRAFVFGLPAIVDAATGVVLALAYGTGYLLRIRAEDHEAAAAAGCTAVRAWSDGTRTDAIAEFGADWRFGVWHGAEATWLEASAEAHR